MDAPSLKHRFRGLTELGRGGMGVVYRGFDPVLGREVAIKTVLDQAAPSRLDRFRREGEITAALSHPGIVRVHSTGVAGGTPFLVYELIEGVRTLEQVLPTVELERRLELLRDVGKALGYAHGRGVVHRDVKPENVLLAPDGQPRVADFGLASAAGLARLTQTGAILGTITYMAPELLEGAVDADPTADVWSLGVILYQAVSGEVPFRGDSFIEVAAAIADQDPRPLKTDPLLSAICAKALEKDPSRRYPHAGAFSDDLQAYLSGGAVSASRALPWSRLASQARRPIRLLVPIVAALALLAYVYKAAPVPEPLDPQVDTPSRERAPDPSPDPGPEPSRLDPGQVTNGNRELGQISRTDNPRARLEATQRWLESYPGHPRQEEAWAYLEEYRLNYPLLRLQHAREGTVGAEFLPDGRALTWSRSGDVAIWDPNSDHPLRRWQVRDLGVAAVHGEDLLLLGYKTIGRVRQLDEASDLDVARTAIAAVPTRRTAVAVDPDGGRLYVGSADGTVVELDLASGANLRAFTGLRSTGVYAVAVSPDGTRLVASDNREGEGTAFGGESIHLRVWNLADGEAVAGFEVASACLTIVFTPDSQSFLIGMSNGQLTEWSRDGAFLHRFEPPPGEKTSWADATNYGVGGPHYTSIRGLVLSPDGSRLYSCSPWRGEPRTEGFMLREWDMPTRASRRRVVREEGYVGGIFGLVLSPDGGQLLVETDLGAVEVWAAR